MKTQLSTLTLYCDATNELNKQTASQRYASRAIAYHATRDQIESARVFVAHYLERAGAHDCERALSRLSLAQLRAIAPFYAQRADSTRNDCIVAIVTCAKFVADATRNAIAHDCDAFNTLLAIDCMFNA